MSLTADLLFKAPPPVFHGRVRTHHPDNKPIGVMRESMEQVPRRINRDNQQKITAIMQAIRAGHNTITLMQDHTGMTAYPIHKRLMNLMADKKITRYGKKSTGYFYQEAV